MILFSPCSIFGYSQDTHRHITTKSIQLLDFGSTYTEVSSQIFSDRLTQGAFDEDEPASRGATHFYNPITRIGLHLGIFGQHIQFQNALAIATQSVSLMPAAIFGESNWWNIAIQKYKSGDKIGGYHALGRSAHLLTQDLAQPYHVHNDPHLPHTLELAGLTVTINGDDAPYENYSNDAVGGSVYNGAVGVTSASDVVALAVQTATNTYHNSKYSVISTGFDTFGREFREVSIGSQLYTMVMVPADPFGAPAAQQGSHFVILPGGSIARNMIFNPFIVPIAGEDGGTNYQFSNDFWQIPDNTQSQFYYFDRSSDFVDESGVSLNQLYLRRFAPLSIENTAGLLKLFAQTVDRKSPEISVQGPAGAVSNNGTTTDTSLTFTVIDPIDGTYPNASGIYRIVVDGPTPSTMTYAGKPDGPPGSDTRTFSLNLSTGSYKITAYDGLGNSSFMRFTISVNECQVDPNSTACQQECQNGNTASCQDACKSSNNGPSSITCIDYCYNFPSDPVCVDNCKAGPRLPYCDDSCANQESSQACKDRCRNPTTAQTTPECDGLCKKDTAYCPDDPGNDPGVSPSPPPPGGKPPLQPNGCGPPLTTFHQFCGWQGSSFHVSPGGPSGALTAPGRSCMEFPLTVTKTGTTVFSIKTISGLTGAVKTIPYVVFLRACAVDPTFLGGNYFIFQLPGPTPALLDAFSPAVVGSTNAIFTKDYRVFGANSEVFILVRDAAGNLIMEIASGLAQPGGNQTFTWDGTDDNGTLQPEGRYTYTVAQSDIQDSKQSSAFSGDVEIDNTLPTVSFGTVSISSSNPTTLEIAGTVSDAHLKSYQVERATAASGPYSLLALESQAPANGIVAEINQTLLPDGVHYLRLTATDLAGLSAQATRSFVIDRRTAGHTGVPVQVGTLSQTLLNPGGTNPPADNPTLFVEDTLSAQQSFNWSWKNSPVYSGQSAHTDIFADNVPGSRLHYFIQPSTGRTLASGENIIQYVYLDAASPPDQILLGFYTDQGDGEHRVYWGSNRIQTGGTSGTSSLIQMGPLPPKGQWIRLKIPAAILNLEGKTIKGMVFGAYGGRATWDRTTTSTNMQDKQTANALPVPPLSGITSLATSIDYTLVRPAHVRLDVYDYATQSFVKTIADSIHAPGTYTGAWDQTDALNSPVPDGNYYFAFHSNDGPIDSEAIVIAGTTTAAAVFLSTVTDADLNEYRLDPANHEVTKWTPTGLKLTTISLGNIPPATGIAIVPTGSLLVQTSSDVVALQVGRVDFANKSLSANIRIPWDSALVRATVPIIGGASGRNFASYIVDVAPTWATTAASSWTHINQGYSQVIDDFVFPDGSATVYGNLGTWETGLVGGEEYPLQDLFHPPLDMGFRGRWTIRLRALDANNQVTESLRKVIIGRVINNTTGGLIVSDDGHARIKVPALSLLEDWSIFGLVTATTTAPAYQPPLPKGLIPVGSLYELIPSGYQFNQKLTFEIGVDTATLAKAGTSVTANRIGLYRYNHKSGGWDRQYAQHSVVVDTTTGATADLYSSPTLTSIPRYNGFYSLYADTMTSVAPFVTPLPSTTNRRNIVLTGVAEPSRIVVVYLTSGSSSSSTIRASYIANPQGSFNGTLVFPSTGTFGVAAATQDSSGNVGPLSPEQIVQVLDSIPSDIQSVRFTDVQYSTQTLVSLQRGSPVFFEMAASDIDPAVQDSVYAVLSSSVSDPAGIVVPLVQINTSSPVYRGSAFLGGISDPTFGMLKAQVFGERVQLVALSSPAVSAALPLIDLTLPAAPRIFSATHPSAVQDTFERDLNQWKTFSAVSGAAVTLSTSTASSGQNAVRLEQLTGNGDFSALLRSQPFDLRTSPVVSFDYKFPVTNSVPFFSLYFRRNGIYHQVEMTEVGKSAKHLPGAFVGIGSYMKSFAGYQTVCTQGQFAFCTTFIKGDDQWHHAEVDLLGMFKAAYPNDAHFTIDQVMLGHYDQTQYFGMKPGNNSVGDTVHFDNFIIRSAGVANVNPFITWVAPPGHITGYSYVLDQSTGTVPPAMSMTVATALPLTNVGSGLWYFHLRAQNAQGVWGPANHYVFRVDTVAPVLSQPSPASQLPPLRTSETKASILVQDDSGLDLDSLVFTVNGASYTVLSGGVSFDVASGSLSITLGNLNPKPVIQDGDLVTLLIHQLRDRAGNRLAQPFAWTWQADFSAAVGGDFGPVTFNGGKDPSWSGDSQRLAFVSNRFGNDDLFVLSAQGSNPLFESTATLTRVTLSSARETEPSWSPDGARLAYVSDTSGVPQIWMTNSDGSGQPVQLTSGTASDTHPSWSADGSLIFFARATSGLGNLWAVELDTQTWSKISEKQITTRNIGFDLSPALSPGSNAIAFHRSLYVDNIESVDSSGVNPVTLTNTGKDVMPSWSPDGNSIVFASKRNSAAYQLWVMDRSGANAKMLVDNANTWPETQPVWSPDGGRIAFTTTRSGAPNIWMLSVLQVSQFSASPSPFSPAGTSASAKKTLTLRYQLSASNALVTLDILNASGQVVATLADKDVQSTGWHSYVWDGRASPGTVLADGSYMARLSVGGAAALDAIIRQVPFVIDSAPPALQLLNSSGGLGNSSYYNPSTVFSIQAADRSPLVQVELAIDTTTQFSVAPSTFSLSSGTHTIAYRALDAAGNLNVPLVRTVIIDDTPPVSTVAVRGPYAVGVSGELYVSDRSSFTITAVDPSSASAVSGVFQISTSMDSGPIISGSTQVDVGPLTSEGYHLLHFYALDAGGNVETAKDVTLFADFTPPVAAVAGNPPFFFNGSHYYVSTGTAISLVAQDLTIAGSASGVQQIFVSTGASTLVPYISTFSFATEGARRVLYSATDRVLNASSLSALNLVVNNNPPTAVIQISTPNYTNGSDLLGVTHFVSTQTRFGFTVAPGAPVSGSFLISVDSGAYFALTSAESFALSSEGPHVISFAAVRGGVAEMEDTYAVTVDTTPPTSSLVLGQGSSGTSLRPDTVITLVSTDTASGVDTVVYTLDGLAFVYNGPFTLGAKHGLISGTHLFEWSAIDHLGNAESVHNQTLVLDSQPPTVTLQFVGGEQFHDGFFQYASSTTAFGVNAQDAESGVQHIFVDSGTGSGYQLYTDTFAYTSQGMKTIQTYAEDFVGNVGAAQLYRVMIDTAAPQVTLSTIGPVVQIASVTYITASTSFDIATGADVLSGLRSVTILADGLSSGSPMRFQTEGPHTLEAYATDKVGNETTPHVFRTLVTDNTAPLTQLQVGATMYGAGVITIPPQTLVAIISTDTAVGVSSVSVSIDSAPPVVTTSTFVPIPLSSGSHMVTAFAIDALGRAETPQVFQLLLSTEVPVDTVAPMTSIGFSSYTVVNGSVTLSTSSVISLVAVDSGTPTSGVVFTDYAVDGGTFTRYSSSFVIASTGMHTVFWFSEDNAGNQEIVQSTNVFVVPSVVIDTSVPVAQLLSPAPAAREMDQIWGRGIVPVVGTVGGDRFSHYSLESAPGAGATTGFTSFFSSTTVISSGTLGLWNTSTLSGHHTLRLTSTASNGAVAVSTAVVVIGEPATLTTLRNPPKKKNKARLVINKPHGIVVDPAGNIFLANAGGDEIVKLAPNGQLIARMNGLTQLPNGRKEYFSSPTGVALDLMSNIYVADRNNHRVAILDPAGHVIQSLGAVDNRGRFISGSGPGEFRTPAGVAVQNGRLVVADPGNARLQVFNTAGSFLFEVRAPASMGAMHPVAVALDGSGRLAATDAENQRVLIFDGTGQWLATRGTKGTALGQFQSPQGIAASALGAFTVADQTHANVQKMDPYLNFVLSFKATNSLVAPMGAAFDVDGRLWVTDRERNMVFAFGLKPGALAGEQWAMDPENLMDSDRDNEGAPFPVGTGDASFLFREVFVYPNPARGGAIPTLHMEVGMADQVTLTIFNVAGQALHQSVLTQAPTLMDSGNGPEYAYEYSWTEPVASGVYLYVIDAQKGGVHLKKSGKFAVVR